MDDLNFQLGFVHKRLRQESNMPNLDFIIDHNPLTNQYAIIVSLYANKFDNSTTINLPSSPTPKLVYDTIIDNLPELFI